MGIKGFEKLTKEEASLFNRIHKKHLAALGMEAKKAYQPLKVKKYFRKQCFIETFKNKEFRYYLPRGEWY